MSVVLWVLGSVVLVSLISLIGILTLWINEKTVHKYLLLLVSFAAGALLGESLIHLLPEAFEAGGEQTLFVSLEVLGGIFVFLVLERFLHWHHYHHFDPCDGHTHEKPVGVMNLISDGIHNFIDGMLVAGSYLVSVPLGIATTIAVVLHEVPQEISDFGILLHAGFTKQKALLFNFLSALLAVAGALVVLALNNTIEGLETTLIAFTAGGFLYIAGSDLIPEINKETRLRQSFLQLVFFVLGILVMAVLLLLE